MLKNMKVSKLFIPNLKKPKNEEVEKGIFSVDDKLSEMFPTSQVEKKYSINREERVSTNSLHHLLPAKHNDVHQELNQLLSHSTTWYLYIQHY